MATSDLPPDTSPAVGERSKAIKTSGTANFRSVRLKLSELRAVQSALAGTDACWRFTKSDSVGVPKESSTVSYSRTRIFEADTLDRLIAAAPKGRLFHFEVESTSPTGVIQLRVGKPRRKARWLMLYSEAAGPDLPDAFHDIAAVMELAEKRGARLHYLGLLIGPTLAVYLPILIFTLLWPGLGLFANPPADVEDKPVLAVTLSILAFLFLLPLGIGVYSRIAASSATLRARFDPSALKPKADLASIPQRALNGLIGIFRWVASLYRHDEFAEQKMLIATVTAAMFGIGSFIIATLAWLFPLK